MKKRLLSVLICLSMLMTSSMSVAAIEQNDLSESDNIIIESENTLEITEKINKETDIEEAEIFKESLDKSRDDNKNSDEENISKSINNDSYIFNPADWDYSINEQNQALFYRYIGRDANVFVPSNIIIENDSYQVIIVNEDVSQTQTKTALFSNNSFIENVIFDNNIKFKNNRMYFTFYNCTNLKNVEGIPNNIAFMISTFEKCKNMTESPALPQNLTEMSATYRESGLEKFPSLPANITSMNETFSNCYNLEYAGELPEGLESMSYIFSNCYNLKSAPKIPSSVTWLVGAFRDCRSLVQAPEIPEGVSELSEVFLGCSSLVKPPKIPESVTSLHTTFFGCSSMIEAPDIPSNVRWLRMTFNDCESLQGEMTIYADITMDISDTLIESCFSGAATRGTGLKVNYSERCIGIDKIIATKSSESIIAKGRLVDPEINVTYNDTEIIDYWLKYRRYEINYLCKSSNFPHVQFIGANDDSLFGQFELIMGSVYYQGSDGWKNLMSAKTSIDNAEKILIGLIEEYDDSIESLAVAKTGKKFASIFQQTLEKYLKYMGLDDVSIKNAKDFLGGDEFTNTFARDGYQGIVNKIVTTAPNESKNILKNSLADFQVSDALAKGISFLDYGLKGIDLVKLGVDKVFQYQVLVEADNIYLEMLDYLSRNCIYDIVRQAAANLKEKAQMDVNQIRNTIMAEVTVAAGEWIGEEAINKLIDSCHFLKILKVGFTSGSSLSNLFFHTSDTLNLKDSVRTISYIGQGISSWTMENLTEYLGSSDTNTKNLLASKSKYSMKMLQKVRQLGEQSLQNLSKSFWSKNIYNLSISTSSEIKIANELLFNLNENYIADYVTIKCPVDLEIYDSSDQFISKIKDGEESYNILNGCVLNVVYDELNDDYIKTISFRNDQDYNLRIIGNDSGVVSFSKRITQSSGDSKIFSRANIPVTKSTIANTTTNESDQKIIIKESGETKECRLNEEIQDTFIPISNLQLKNVPTKVLAGEQIQLEIGVLPENATYQTIEWASDNISVIKINNDGILSAISSGTATITATATDGSNCKVSKELIVLSPKYNILYELNGGENNLHNPDSYTVESEDIILKEPEKVGYSFDGWYTDKEFNCSITKISKGSSNDLTLYAKWIPNGNILYKVEHYKENIDGKSYSLYEAENKSGLSDTMATASPMDYIGYVEDLSNPERIPEGIIATDGSLKLKLFYNRIKYIVNYDINDSNQINPMQQSILYGGKVFEPINLSRKGYKFLGWYNDDVKWNFEEDTVTEDMELKATWTAINYIVKYNLNGGSDPGNPKNYNIESDTINLMSPTRMGYIFGGWYRNQNYTSEIQKIVSGSTGDILLYAKWEPIKYSINYNLYGGTGAVNPTAYTIETETFSLKSPSRKGYSFAGWYSDSSYRQKVDMISKGTTGNKTLYAKWLPIAYGITYNLNKGKNSNSNPGSFNIETNIELKNPIRKGYMFSGWYSDSNYKNKVVKIPQGSIGNKTLFAKWSKVNVKKVSISKIQNVKNKQLKVIFKRLSGDKGYQVQYSTSKKFTKKYTKSVAVKQSSKKTLSKIIKKLKKNKTYHVRVRAYKVDSCKNNVYGKWSKVKKIKITK